MNKLIRSLLTSLGIGEKESDTVETWRRGQKLKLETGEEIQPPWLFAKDTEPWSPSWRQGNGEFWLVEIWMPFWKSMSETEQNEYLKRYPTPTQDWNEYLTTHWDSK